MSIDFSDWYIASIAVTDENGNVIFELEPYELTSDFEEKEIENEKLY